MLQLPHRLNLNQLSQATRIAFKNRYTQSLSNLKAIEKFKKIFESNKF